MNKSNGFRTQGRTAVVMAAAVAAMSTITSAGVVNPTQEANRPNQGIGKSSITRMLDINFDRLLNVGGGRAGGDVALNWVGGGANTNWSTGANWAGGVGPTGSTNDPTFGATPAGNYTTVNDTTAALGILTVTRTNATDTTTIQGGYRGTELVAANGRLVIDGGTSTVTSTTAIGIRVGAATSPTGNASLIIQNGAVVNYNDALAGFAAGATTNLTVTGAGTRLQPIDPTFDGYFGGNGGTTNILVDNGAQVSAYLSRQSLTSSYIVRNGAGVTLNAIAANNAPVGYFGNVTDSNTTFEISNGGTFTVNDAPGASLSNIGNFGLLWVGSGPGGTTTGNILSGGKVKGGIVSLGASNYTATGTQTTVSPRTTTVNVSGAGSEVRGEILSINGLGVYSNLSVGTTNFNVLNGGKASGTVVILGGSDRPATTTVNNIPVPPIVTNTLISGTGSLLSGEDALGAAGDVYLVWGDGDILSTTTVENGGRISAGFLGDAGVGNKGVLNVNAGGTVDADFVNTGAGNGSIGTDLTINLNGGGKLNTNDVVTGEGFGGKTTFNVSGAGSELNVDQFFQTGGFSSTTSGTGATLLNVSNGGSATLGFVIGGLANAIDFPADPNGTAFKVDGAGSVIKVQGFEDNDAVAEDDLPAVVTLGRGVGNVASIEVTNGGLFDISPLVGPSELFGQLAMANSDLTQATVTVDGAGSTLNVGNGTIFMADASDEAPFGDASATINVRNGGTLTADGNIQMTTNNFGGLNATVNVGGGSNPTTDADSLIDIGGTLFVGGSGTAAAPEVGAPATVNLNNGAIFTGATLVYQGSTVNITRGTLAGGIIAARGGNIIVNASTPAGQAVLLADEFEASNGGYIDIAKGGGISLYDSAAAEPDLDLAEIRGLIVAGYNNGTWDGVNGIRSSAITAGSRFGIGYTDIDIAGITEFLGVEFDAADQAIVFRTTLKGDVNLDLTVNFADLLALAQGYNKPGEWFNGDSNYDGAVDFSDLLSLAQNYNATYSLTEGLILGDSSSFAADWALAQSLAVPEPASLGLLAGGLMLVRRRRQA